MEYVKFNESLMNTNSRIALNTIVIYIGVIFCTIISLVTVPVLLRNLGTSDYGLYNLVAGIIAMLAFLKSSMIVTVQRYMNVAYGAKDYFRVNKIYSISLLLYFVVAIVTTLVISLLGPFISNGYLNIESGRVSAAIMLFRVLIISTFFTTISIPFDALFNVYEEMWFFSIYNIFEAVGRLSLAYLIGLIAQGDKLVAYAIGMAAIAVITFLLKVVTCKVRYRGIKFLRLSVDDISIVKDILSFIGWNLYGTLARIFSNQGFAIVLNLFSGTTINASYGIANQVNGSLQHFTSSVEKAFNPQIMKSEGMKDRSRVVQMALFQTKFCSLIYNFFAIPLLFSVPFILKIWLKTPPEYSVEFTRIVIIASMVSLLCSGLSSTFYAVGKIKSYIIWIGTCMIVNVFFAYGCLRLGFSVVSTVSLFILLEVILCIIRLAFARHIVGLSIHNYFSFVLKPILYTMIPTLLVACCIPCNSFQSFLLMGFMTVSTYVLSLYFWGLTKDERVVINCFVKKFYYGYKEKNISK